LARQASVTPAATQVVVAVAMAVAMAADVAVAMAVQGVAKAAVHAMEVAAVRRVVTVRVAAARRVVTVQVAARAVDADAAEAVMMARPPRGLGSRPAHRSRTAKQRQPMELLVPSATAIAAAREAETLQAAPKQAPRLPQPNNTTAGGLAAGNWEPGV
jgi:hypothetical protein